MFFTDQFDNHPWEAPPELQPPQKKPGSGGWPPRRRNVSSQDDNRDNRDTRDKDDLELGDKDPAATLQAMAGKQTLDIQIF